MRERLARAAKDKAVAKKAKLEEDGEELHDLEGADGEEAQISFIEKPRFKLPKASKKAVKDPLSKLPLDIWAVLCQQGILEASDLLVLSRLSRSLRRVFCHISSEQVWHACFEAMDPAIPVLPDISAPHLANLFQGGGCDLCKKIENYRGQGVEVFFALRKRLCTACVEENIVHEDEIEETMPDLAYDCLDLVHSGPYEERLRVRAHHSYKAARKSIEDWDGEPRSFFLPELLEWQEICEDEDNASLIQKRKRVIESLVKLEGGQDFYKQWTNNRYRVQAERAEEAAAERRTEKKNKIEHLSEILTEVGVSEDRIEALNLNVRAHALYWRDALDKEEWTDEDHQQLVRQVEAAEFAAADDRLLTLETAELVQARDRLKRRRERVAAIVRQWIYSREKVDINAVPSVDDLMANGLIALLALDATGNDLTDDEEELIKEELPKMLVDRLMLIKAAFCSVNLGDPHTMLAADDADGQAALLNRADMFWRCTNCKKMLSYTDALQHHYDNHRDMPGYHRFAANPPVKDTQFREDHWEAPRSSRRFATKLLSIVQEDADLSDDEVTWEGMDKLGACWVVDGNIEEPLTWNQVINTVCSKPLYAVQIHKITDKEKAHAAMDEAHAKATCAVYKCYYCRRRQRRLTAATEFVGHVRAKHRRFVNDDIDDETEAQRAAARCYDTDRDALKLHTRNTRVEREKNGCEDGCCICSGCEECLSGDVNDDMLGKHMLTTT